MSKKYALLAFATPIILLAACGSPKSAGGSAVSATSPTSPNSIAGASRSDDWKKSGSNSALDGAVLTASKDFTFDEQKSVIKVILSCVEKTRSVEIRLESYFPNGDGTGAPAPIRGGRMRIGASEPTQLGFTFLPDAYNNVLSAHPGALAGLSAFPTAEDGEKPGDVLKRSLPIAVEIKNDHGTLELTIPQDSDAINSLIQACSATPEEVAADKSAKAAAASQEAAAALQRAQQDVSDAKTNLATSRAAADQADAEAERFHSLGSQWGQEQQIEQRYKECLEIYREHLGRNLDTEKNRENACPSSIYRSKLAQAQRIRAERTRSAERQALSAHEGVESAVAELTAATARLDELKRGTGTSPSVEQTRSPQSGSSRGEAVDHPAISDAAGSASNSGSTIATGSRTTGRSPSFDCAKAASAVERMICATPTLAASDAELAAYYKKNLDAAGASAPSVKASQRMFIAKRESCKSVDCVLEAYRARHEELAQMGFVKE